jgi:hypothetical protein
VGALNWHLDTGKVSEGLEEIHRETPVGAGAGPRISIRLRSAK